MNGKNIEQQTKEALLKKRSKFKFIRKVFDKKLKLDKATAKTKIVPKENTSKIIIQKSSTQKTEQQTKEALLKKRSQNKLRLILKNAYLTSKSIFNTFKKTIQQHLRNRTLKNKEAKLNQLKKWTEKYYEEEIPIKKEHHTYIAITLIVILAALSFVAIQSNSALIGEYISSITAAVINVQPAQIAKTTRDPLLLGMVENETSEIIITEAMAEEALLKANKTILELKVLNFSTQYMLDAYLEAKKAFDGKNVAELSEKIKSIKNETEKQAFLNALNTTFTSEEIKRLAAGDEKIRENYTRTLIYTSLIEQRKELTFEINDEITLLEEVLSGLNRTEYNFTEVDLMHAEIKEKFEKEQLDEIKPIIEEAYRKIEEVQLESARLRAFFKAARQNIGSFIKRHWLAIIITSVILSFIAWITYNEVMITILRKRISDMRIEQNVLKDLTKKIQKNYFGEGSIPKSVYEIRKLKYEERNLQIKEQLPVVEANLEKKENKRFYLLHFWRK